MIDPQVDQGGASGAGANHDSAVFDAESISGSKQGSPETEDAGRIRYSLSGFMQFVGCCAVFLFASRGLRDESTAHSEGVAKAARVERMREFFLEGLHHPELQEMTPSYSIPTFTTLFHQALDRYVVNEPEHIISSTTGPFDSLPANYFTDLEHDRRVYHLAHATINTSEQVLDLNRAFENKDLERLYAEYVETVSDPAILSGDFSEAGVVVAGQVELDSPFFELLDAGADWGAGRDQRDQGGAVSCLSIEEFQYLIDTHRFMHQVFNERDANFSRAGEVAPEEVNESGFSKVAQRYLSEVVAKHSDLLPHGEVSLGEIQAAFREGVEDTSRMQQRTAGHRHEALVATYIALQLLSFIWGSRQIVGGLETKKVQTPAD